MTNYAQDAQDLIADRIAAIDGLRGQDYRLIRQNRQELRYLIDCNLAQVASLLIVVAVDDIDPLDEGVADVHAKVIISESVAVHRTGPEAMTAMDAAQLIGEEIGRDGIKWRGVKQEAGDDGILVATSEFEMYLGQKEG